MNQLDHVYDAIGSGIATNDLDEQACGNYEYDASGNRVVQIIGEPNTLCAVYEYYVYATTGNLMATYEEFFAGNLGGTPTNYTEHTILKDRNIYGATRIGSKYENREITSRDFNLDGGTSFVFNQVTVNENTHPENIDKTKRIVGYKQYEMANHLGNVLNVVTDRKVGNVGGTGYEADIVSYSDYYPYGMILPGRHGTLSGAEGYRYGFQGQEMDDEVKGEGNSVNYKYRMHDPRIGRFFAVDPLTAKYPHYTPYQFSGNKVIDHVELEGLEEGPTLLGKQSTSDRLMKTFSSTELTQENDGFDGIYLTGANGFQEKALNGQSINIPDNSNIIKTYDSDFNLRVAGFETPQGVRYRWNSAAQWYTNSSGAEFNDGSWTNWTFNSAMAVTTPFVSLTVGDGWSQMKNAARKDNSSMPWFVVKSIGNGIYDTGADLWAGGHRRSMALGILGITIGPSALSYGTKLMSFGFSRSAFWFFSAPRINGGLGFTKTFGGYKISGLYQSSVLGHGTVFSFKSVRPSGTSLRWDYGASHFTGSIGSHLHLRVNFGSGVIGTSNQFRLFNSSSYAIRSLVN